MSSALGGASISYVNLNTFADAIGAGGGDLSTTNGCFMCSYIEDLFIILGDASITLWDKIIGKLWIVMALGFGLFVMISGIQHVYDAMQQSVKIDSAEKKIDIKSWLDKLWKNGARIMVVGIILGGISAGGTHSLKAIANITATPILYLGAELGAMATQINGVATCGGTDAEQLFSTENNVLAPVFKPFMCVVRNVNAVVMAGAAGGFALMNYSWMGVDRNSGSRVAASMAGGTAVAAVTGFSPVGLALGAGAVAVTAGAEYGGNVITWVAGLALVLMFMYLGFNLFFQILSIMFKLIFVILFMPLLLAAAAFEKIWSKAAGLLKKSIDMLVSAAVKTLAVTLKVVILFGIVFYVADMFFPGPVDGFTAILPPLAGQSSTNLASREHAIMNVFKKCEAEAKPSDESNKEAYIACFNRERARVESAHDGAFDFMDDGWDFLLMMIFIFMLYLYAIEPKVDKLLPEANSGSNDKDGLDFGAMLKGYMKTGTKGVGNIYGKIRDIALERAK